MKAADLNAGTDYGYRRAPGRHGTPIEQVTLLDATVTNGCVAVRTLDGERRHATLGQLLAPWTEVPALQAEEAAYQRLANDATDDSRLQLDAASLMFQAATNSDVAPIPGGLTLAAPVAAELAHRAGIQPGKLNEPPNFTNRDGDAVLATTTVVAIAEGLARAEPLELLEVVDGWESERLTPSLRARIQPLLDQLRVWTGVSPDTRQTMAQLLAEDESRRRLLIESRAALSDMRRQIDELLARLDRALEHPDA